MTKEEHIIYLENLRTALKLSDNFSNKTMESLDAAIKELEQEPVLDKVRAEIKALSPELTAYDVVDGNPIKDAVWETLADVLQIIDKYRAEGGCKE